MRGGRWTQGQRQDRRRGEPATRIDWLRTFLAKRRQPLQASHLRYRAALPGSDVLHVFVLDCSGSMLKGQALAQAKGVLLALFEQAARKRHRVALVCFGGAGAELRFGPARPQWWNERWIAPIGGGGGTPLAAGLAQAGRVLDRDERRGAGAERWLWLLSDGRSNERAPWPQVEQRIVVDFEQGVVRLGRSMLLARQAAAEYVRWEVLAGDRPTARSPSKAGGAGAS